MNTNNRFVELMSSLLDDDIATDEMAELYSLISIDPALRSHLVEHLLLDTLLEENLGREPLTALIDTVSDGALTPPPQVGTKVARYGFRPLLPMNRWGWLAIVAGLVIVISLFSLQDDREANANASQIVQAAMRTHAEPIERIYVVEVKRGDASDTMFELPRDVRVATQGDQFWVQMRGYREWTWGRNRQGSIWMTLGPRRAVVVDPQEMGKPLRYIGDLYSLNLETLLQNFLKHCRLEVSEGPAESTVILATPQRQWSNRRLKSATLEVDRETKAIRKLVIEREFERAISITTFSLVDSRLANESLYGPEGHLSEPYRIFASETEATRRRELIHHWFGLKSDQWIQIQENQPN
jgi:hypothetical protein